ncbi:MAG: zinc-dependent alcohol dehydrogenase family protein [Rubripirellula sp.]
MLEIQFNQFGPPSVVAKCVNVPDDGVPSAWDAIVRVDAFPINPADLAMLAGRYGNLPKLPATIGMEASGKIVRVGESVETLAVGDQVMIMANNNWGQYRKVPATLLHKVPDNLCPLQAAMMKVNPATALLLLTQEAELKRGDWVIQNAPLSNVGRAVIQIAKARGFRTVNIVRREDARQAVLDLGGNVAVHTGDDLAKDVQSAIGRAKIRLALDAVGGESTQQLALCLAERSRIVNYGMLSGEACRLEPEQTIFRGITLSGFWLSKIVNRMTHTQRIELYDEILAMLVAGSLRGQVDMCYGLDQVSEAIQRAERGDRQGKVLVLPNGPVQSESVILGEASEADQ